MDMIMRLRSRGISDNRVLGAIETIPRRRFVDPDYQMMSYDEKALPIACGQTLSPPLAIAQMTQILGLSPDHKTLHIGSGSGYHTALMAQLCRRVYAVERYKTLVKSAEQTLQNCGVFNAVIRHGDGRYGWPGQAPFDRILLSVAVRAVPDALMDQLSTSGVLVASVDGDLMMISKARTRISEKMICPLSLPMIEAGKSKSL